ncbi:MAG: Coenzyme F420 hydrogenase/dehydrogenase, beta subunit C-terminal domain [Actinobacteria bacterium]|nr:Coenzyme F420 hydrogenase/dehydrogenase, beta subunit C-terminal domain [Actinomycetota bacterium]
MRETGTSGGVVTALLGALLAEGYVTAVLATTFDTNLPYRPVPVLLRDWHSVQAAAQSKYALTPQLTALRDARPSDRLAVVGLPCQVAGLRKASLAGHLRQEIVLSVGLFCLSSFHLDATRFIVEQVMGLFLDDVTRLEYRHGPFPGSFSVSTRAGERHSMPYSEAKQYLRMFRPYRCIVCFDWSAELADISAGDLWSDPSRHGYTSLLVRTPGGAKALEIAERLEAVRVEPVGRALIVQNPGFYYKKHGNAVFIRDARRYGLPCPTYP